MEEFAAAFGEVFGRRLSPLLRALERERIAAEVAARAAGIIAAELAALDRADDERRAEQRRRLADELAANRERAEQQQRAAALDLWLRAAKAVTQAPDEPPELNAGRKRRGEGEGEFRKLAAKFVTRLQARRRGQFSTAARNRLRRVRIIRLSREAWGPPDAHLHTTLDLFNQLGSGASPGASNVRAFRSHPATPPEGNSHRL